MFIDEIGEKPIAVLFNNYNNFSFKEFITPIPKIERKIYGDGLAYSKKRPMKNNVPWIELSAFYGELTLMSGYLVAGGKFGVGRIGFKTDYGTVEIRAAVVTANVGPLGGSLTMEFCSISGEIEFENSLAFSAKLYAGIGFSADLSKGLKIGLGFFEIAVEFDWNKIL